MTAADLSPRAEQSASLEKGVPDTLFPMYFERTRRRKIEGQEERRYEEGGEGRHWETRLDEYPNGLARARAFPFPAGKGRSSQRRWLFKVRIELGGRLALGRRDVTLAADADA